MSKVVFSSLFFSHRITVKPLPRQLDLAAASCHFPAQTNTLERVRHFFFYLRRRRFKPILGSKDFLYFFPVFVFSLRLFIYLFIFLLHRSDFFCIYWQSAPLYSFHFLKNFCLQNLFSWTPDSYLVVTCVNLCLFMSYCWALDDK